MKTVVVKRKPDTCRTCRFRELKINSYDDFENHCKMSDDKKIDCDIFFERASWCPLVSLDSYIDNGDGTFTENDKEVNTDG